ncbi:MAG: aldehyde dehydrogenase family protein [Betaproteobacteria bacterium]|nr:aldehyde dehydrogenase family protein [Betaproteobacteria bacterium]
MQILNPATGESIGRVEADDAASVREKFAVARDAQPAWATRPLQERVLLVKRFGELLKRDLEHVARDMTLEMGKPLQQARNEVNGSLNKIRFFTEEVEKTLAPEKVRQDGNTEEILAFDPLGVVLNISAWNYPILVGFNVFLPALLCGNAVVYKPSEHATLTGLHLTRLLHEAGIPQSVFIAIVGDGVVGAELLKLPFDCVGFTGSFATGKRISETLAGRMTRLIMELGGKDPLYVTEECGDLDAVADAVAEGVLYNNGQSCCAVERVYVHEKIHDAFVEKLKAKMQSWKVGDPLDPSTLCGAITRQSQIPFLQNQVDDAIAKGAKLVLGGKALEGKGQFFPPTLLLNVNHKMDIMREESFGPIIGVMKVKDDHEAAQLMNDSEYGLTSSVYCRNLERGKRILAQINTGTGYLNCCDRVSAWLPWSGRGASGVGSTLSRLGIYAFCHAKGLHVRS